MQYKFSAVKEKFYCMIRTKEQLILLESLLEIAKKPKFREIEKLLNQIKHSLNFVYALHDHLSTKEGEKVKEMCDSLSHTFSFFSGI